MSQNKRIFGNELKYVKEVLETEYRSSKGSKFMTLFEKKFAEKFESKFAISFNNGTATLHAALEAAGIKEGDEVIVPPLTMSSTTFAVLQANATPVFADVDRKSFVISPKSIKEKITNKTKAIITVSLYGMAPDMDAICKVATEHNLFLLEDNAQCFGGTYNGKKIGKFGEAASYSFQSSKHLTAGEGGIVITDNEELAVSMRRISSLGYAGVGASKGKITKKDIQDPGYYRHVTMGWNYRISELCAAVALAQTENMDQLIGKRVEAARIFHDAISDCNWLKEQNAEYDFENTYWSWAVAIDHEHINWHEFRDKFLKLGGDGIYAAWKLTYQEPMFENGDFLRREKYISEDRLNEYKTSLCPNAEWLQSRILAFKTNYWDIKEAVIQAKILQKTINYFT